MSVPSAGRTLTLALVMAGCLQSDPKPAATPPAARAPAETGKATKTLTTPASTALGDSGWRVTGGGPRAEPVHSADWLAQLPDGETKRKFVVGCTPCHQIGPPVAMRQTKAQWDEVNARMQKTDDELELKLIPFKPGELSEWLAKHVKFPKEGNPAGAITGRWEEFELGAIGVKGMEFFHDVAVVQGWVWIAGYFSNQLYGLNPETGERVSYPIPVDVAKGKPGGAHAMDTTRAGALYLTFTKSEQVARFDVKTRKFRMYSGFPKGWNVQYLALDADRFVYEDDGGGIWVNHFSKESLSRLDPVTGAITSFDTPRTDWLPEKGVHLYAVVAASDGKLWYTETHGNRLGYLDPKTGDSEEWPIFESWSGPKRLAIDDQDVLWIPHLAVPYITVYDTKTRKTVDKVPVPIPGDYVYGIRRDRFTGDLWATGSGSDSAYRIDPKNKTFTIYRLPRLGAYTRTFAFEEDGTVWTNYSSFPSSHVQTGFKVSAVLRLRPEARVSAQ